MALLAVPVLLASLALAGGSPLPDPYLAELQARADGLHLAEEPAWLRLGHWRPRLLGGVEGEADGPGFYVAPGGKRDPAAELKATLAAFFDASPKADELDDAQCRFPARFAWIAGRLGVDLARLPPRPCPRFAEFYGRVAANGATLVFSSWYLNNPASAFGHTLLRLDKARGAVGGRDAELLDYGVNYAANPDGANALSYVFRGLLGGFRGQFSHYPYYYKVREYAEYESRDLWEYDLALSPGEVAMLVGHLYELGGTWFDYWYLDENCSYHVLAALEAAAPRLDLLSHVGAIVLPADTVKALFRNPGLVRDVRYRPSLRRIAEARLAALSDEERALVRPLLGDSPPALPAWLGPPRSAAVLDAALDVLDLEHGRAILHATDPAASALRQRLLARRSELRIEVPRLELPPPPGARPELGHPMRRLGLGAGFSGREGALAFADLRLSLHDLADPLPGHPPSAQIEFLPIRAAFSTRTGRLAALDASLFRIQSLNGVTALDRRPSWRIRLGADLVRDGGCAGCVAAVAEGGSGFALLDLLGAVDLHAGLDASLAAAPGLDGIAGAPVRLGVGPTALARLRLGQRATLLANGRWLYLPGAHPTATWSASVEARAHLNRRFSLAASWRADPADWLAGGMLLGYF